MNKKKIYLFVNCSGKRAIFLCYITYLCNVYFNNVHRVCIISISGDVQFHTDSSVTIFTTDSRSIPDTGGRRGGLHTQLKWASWGHVGKGPQFTAVLPF